MYIIIPCAANSACVFIIAKSLLSRHLYAFQTSIKTIVLLNRIWGLCSLLGACACNFKFSLAYGIYETSKNGTISRSKSNSR